MVTAYSPPKRLADTPSWDPEREPYERWLDRFRRRLLVQIDDQMAEFAVKVGVRCHNYWRVSVGQKCCLCGERVKAKSSGIGCRCGHRWFCW